MLLYRTFDASKRTREHVVVVLVTVDISEAISFVLSSTLAFANCRDSFLLLGTSQRLSHCRRLMNVAVHLHFVLASGMHTCGASGRCVGASSKSASHTNTSFQATSQSCLIFFTIRRLSKYPLYRDFILLISGKHLPPSSIHKHIATTPASRLTAALIPTPTRHHASDLQGSEAAEIHD